MSRTYHRARYLIERLTDPYTYRGLALWAVGIAIPYSLAVWIVG